MSELSKVTTTAIVMMMVVMILSVNILYLSNKINVLIKQVKQNYCILASNNTKRHCRIVWRIGLFLGNSHETNNRTASVARQKILNMQEWTIASMEWLSKRIPTAMNRCATMEVLLKE
jgi:hypothetical protein